MDDKTFHNLREIVYQKSGISLGENKRALLCARLGKRMRKLGISEYRDYYDLLLNDESGNEIIHMLDAVSTNVTSFFREPEHFDFLKQHLIELYNRKQEKIRIWSAACSTGEEPYSLAMTFLDSVQEFKEKTKHEGPLYLDVKILATDISTKVLDFCDQAMYLPDKLKYLPPLMKERYFERDDVEGVKVYQLKDMVRELVQLERLNLSEIPFPIEGTFDVIFCRNVMIYFDNDLRKKLVREFYRLLNPGGVLIVGHAESLIGRMENFESVKPSIYIKK